MSRGLCRVGAGGWTVSRKKEQGSAFGRLDRPHGLSPPQSGTTAGKLSIYYLVLLNEPDGNCLVPTIVLAAHQWPLLLHPVLSSDASRKHWQEWSQLTLTFSDRPSIAPWGHHTGRRRLLFPWRLGSSGLRFSPLTQLSESSRSPEPHPKRLPNSGDFPDPVASASYLLEGSSLLQVPGLCLTRLLQIRPAAFQLLAPLHDVLGLGVPEASGVAQNPAPVVPGPGGLTSTRVPATEQHEGLLPRALLSHRGPRTEPWLWLRSPG